MPRDKERQRLRYKRTREQGGGASLRREAEADAERQDAMQWGGGGRVRLREFRGVAPKSVYGGLAPKITTELIILPPREGPQVCGDFGKLE